LIFYKNKSRLWKVISYQCYIRKKNSHVPINTINNPTPPSIASSSNHHFPSPTCQTTAFWVFSSSLPSSHAFSLLLPTMTIFSYRVNSMTMTQWVALQPTQALTTSRWSESWPTPATVPLAGSATPPGFLTSPPPTLNSWSPVVLELFPLSTMSHLRTLTR